MQKKGELGMRIEDLGSLEANATLDTDLVIIGGGPAGLSIAREFFGTQRVF